MDPYNDQERTTVSETIAAAADQVIKEGLKIPRWIAGANDPTTWAEALHEIAEMLRDLETLQQWAG